MPRLPLFFAPLFFRARPLIKARMITFPRWLRGRDIFRSESKGPWGSGDGPDDDKKGAGPRNPWAVPPSGQRRPGASALDEFLRRARPGGGGGSGGNGGGGGRGGFGGSSNPRALAAIGVALIALVWILFTSFHPIAPQQRGVVTFLGRYVGTLESGVRLTLPAPLESVAKVDVQNIRTEDFPDPQSSDPENLMLTGDSNIINLSFSVRWNISSPEDYVFQIKDPTSTVRATAESAMREVVANTALDQALGSGRATIETEVQDRMQKILDGYNSGIRVQGVNIKQAVPPQAVNDAFKDVTAAQQDAVAAKNNAQGYAQQLIAKAQGDAAQFDKVYAQYKLAPEVTRRRMYYETMEDVLAKTDKTIVEAPGVLPYLSLKGAQRLPNPDAAQPAQGGAQ
jgi:membrane protease subunit HflK